MDDLPERETQSDRTLAHYECNAESFWIGTRDHDVSQNRAALLRHIAGTPPFDLLDLGCGPGRDLLAFRQLGHRPVGVDGARAFCEMARANAGCEVWEQHFLSLDLPAERFDGVFANASLFHVPTRELPRVLGALAATLRPRGVLLASNPRGNGEEGWKGDRYGAYHREEDWRRFVALAGFVELESYYRPEGLPRAEQPWFVTVWRKLEPAQ